MTGKVQNLLIKVRFRVMYGSGDDQMIVRGSGGVLYQGQVLVPSL